MTDTCKLISLGSIRCWDVSVPSYLRFHTVAISPTKPSTSTNLHPQLIRPLYEKINKQLTKMSNMYCRTIRPDDLSPLRRQYEQVFQYRHDDFIDAIIY
ncbi:hypothetical protein FPSE_07969 [Fusarium pseudograminearum CS3096]|uniref:Uncharacterized protein n=1 Tax=Fusarium pseudograminearum (strain CS3096) TaxID=1028729 RepID=K3VG84_FUSPC|nr:hypothetical protein FPSE_07969 [Fusarium pseudograminearum CS3096]EKJ71868.1 hypothetical protein FPSE_07969 [Fusarium pseudograminearum CS3096]